MKLSTRSRYGLRAMMVLAAREGAGTVMAREIADEQNLPITYLEQLMLGLRKSGLVLATRGAHGGYALARAAESIRLSEIVGALEGPIDIADCADIANCCMDPETCVLKEVFSDANKALFDAFDRVTLGELVSRWKAREAACSPMYFI